MDKVRDIQVSELIERLLSDAFKRDDKNYNAYVDYWTSNEVVIVINGQRFVIGIVEV